MTAAPDHGGWSFRRAAAVAVGGLLGALAVDTSLSAAPRSVELPEPPHPVPAAGQRDVPCPSGARRIAAGTRIQPVVDAAPAGASFCLAAGVHRAQTIAPKRGQSFFGEAGTVLSGARLLSHFRAAGSHWTTHSDPVPVARRGICLPQSPLCDRVEAVFLDDHPLAEVARIESVGPGRFFFDRNSGLLAIGDDPAGHRVEMTAAAFAFLSNHAANASVENLVVEKYATPAQRGAIFDDADAAATGWRIAHNTVRLNSGLGILAGPSSTVAANRVVDNGQLGISLSSHDIAIEGNEVAGNNRRGYDPGWEGGGLKGAKAERIVIRGNFVHDNHGPGLWCDIDCRDVLYEGNRVEDNDGAGIFHEISFDAVVRDNVLSNNGRLAHGWYWGANVLIAASQDVLVTGNRIVVADDGTGIALVDQGRERAGGGTYRTQGNTVRGNTVRFTGAFARMGGVSDVEPGSSNEGVIERGGNRFADNVYHLPPGIRVVFGWGRRELDFAGFRAVGQDEGSQEIAASPQ
ncbi:right-handed parallel beta-helix repeat-containing protein [Jiella sp. M17.18]|uniref:right-handed parallel beta-helix repeat-containing protein n=1 Tax=Jiella sp. M17.18 TaxID=3234247 RepID=UPI0034DFCF2C